MEDKRFIGHYINKLACLIKQDLGKNDLGISGAQGFIISYLNDHGGKCSQSEINKTFEQRRSSITSILNNMEESGLINRVDSETDQRQKDIVLTKKGLELSNKINDGILKNENKLELNISLEELDMAEKVLIKMINNMKEE